VDLTFHFPPELLKLLVDAVPKICKSKKDLLLFFQGAGVRGELLSPHQDLLRSKSEDFNKYRVTQELLTKLNEDGESGLRERREILRRVTEFQEYSLCWPNDQAAARGLVAQIRELVNVKDTFTRLNIEREQERKKRVAVETAKTVESRQRMEELLSIKTDLRALFKETNPFRRGKALEAVLNRYFRHCGILVTEAFTLKGNAGAGIVEQIDGVVELKTSSYLVEMKWESEPLGPEKIGPHLVRVFSRAGAGGLFISYSGYTAAALQTCGEALRQKVIVLCNLEEVVLAIEQERDFKQLLHAKIDAAVIHKNPLFSP
jgi:restriction system protein